MGLYRDDGLAMINGSGPQMDKVRKDIIKAFQDMKLKVTIETNLTVTDFLNITFDLRNGTYGPYIKPGNTIKYVSSKSNHPPSIKREIPRMIQSRLSSISSNENAFEREANVYREALKEAGYNEYIKYTETPPPPKNKRRNRNIIWFRPPWLDTIATKIGAKFLNILSNEFSNDSTMKKLFNRNNTKISYGCLPNMNAFILSKNRQLLKGKNNENVECRCRGDSELSSEWEMWRK